MAMTHWKSICENRGLVS